eukprot:TRINITY_DN11568_c0_g1_i2.p1 TRINITY_DN11568_c0_g1~~TRINITY_DN11568_c0_g1_i2.p1  ORF type:complete len:261 (-),score=14.03 TRINITY_DN11568_c0_g1_i2:145-927(-)
MSVSAFVVKGFVVFSMLSTVFISGCRSSQAEKTVFIPDEYAKLMKDHSEDAGLHRAWGAPDKIRKYDKINVDVIISPRQLGETWWQQQNARRLVASQDEDMKYVAEYAQKSFREAFEKSKYFTLTDKPGSKTLALEFAIVQVVPNKPVLGAMANLSNLTPIGLILFPVKLSLKGVSEDAGGAIAMESVMRDSESGKIVAVFADREKGRLAYFNVKEFTAYANVRAIIDQWTQNIVTALDQIKEGKKVKIDHDFLFTPVDF